MKNILLLNSLVQLFGGTPRAWLTLSPWNNLVLAVILIWIQTPVRKRQALHLDAPADKFPPLRHRRQAGRG